MATQIDLLATLQEIDQRLQQKTQLLQALRQQVTAIILEVETTQREAEEQQQRIRELESQHRAIEGQLKQEEEKIKEKRVRQNRLRNERELLAIRREIELMKEANGKLEEEALLLLEQIDQERSHFDQTCTRIGDLKTKREQETSQVETQIATLEQETQRERREREAMVSLIDADLCARYERIFAKRGGLAVVEIHESACQGCHMHIPPHMCNQIQSSQLQNDGAVFHCPHCGRILRWRITPEEPSDV